MAHSRETDVRSCHTGTDTQSHGYILSLMAHHLPVYLSIYKHTYMHACMHAYIHTYIHSIVCRDDLAVHRNATAATRIIVASVKRN